MNQLTMQEAALAWAQGKKVQAAPSHRPDEWGGIDGVGEESPSSKYTANIFNHVNGCSYIFRLAPEPPPKKFRPWNPEEVPLGAQIREKNRSVRALIIGVRCDDWIHVNNGGFKSEFALDQYEHSTDNGRTWKPCGVEVQS